MRVTPQTTPIQLPEEFYAPPDQWRGDYWVDRLAWDTLFDSFRLAASKIDMRRVDLTIEQRNLAGHISDTARLLCGVDNLRLRDQSAGEDDITTDRLIEKVMDDVTDDADEVQQVFNRMAI